MKYILSIFVLILMVVAIGSQSHLSTKSDHMQDKYPIDKLWKDYQSKIDNEHIKDANKILDKIVKIATEENLRDHLVKATLSQFLLEERLNKGTDFQIYISNIQDKIDHTQDDILRAVYQVYLGRAYARYGDFYYYQNSSPHTDRKDDDYTQWSSKRRSQEVIALYQKALSVEQLDKFNLGNFEALINGTSETRKIFKTVEDVLMYDLVLQFQNTRRNLSDFEIKDILSSPALLAPREEFAQVDFPATEEPSISTVLGIFKNYYDKKISTGSIELINTVDIMRLNLMSSIYTGTDAQKYLYSTAEEMFLSASPSIQQQSYDYWVSHFIQEYNWSELTQKEIYEKHHNIYSKYAHLKSEITNSVEDREQAGELDFEAEQYIVPNEDFILNLNHRNIDHIKWEIKNISDDQIEEISKLDYDQKYNYLKNLNTLTTSDISFPLHNGIRTMSSEISLPGLPSGSYVILISSKSHYGKNQLRYYGIVNASNIRIYTMNDKSIKVIDARSGRRLSGLKYSLYKYEYQRSTRSHEQVNITSGYSSDDGSIDISSLSDLYNINIHLEDKNDMAWFKGVSAYSDNNYLDKETKVEVFTDRSIFRPGQVVHFKIWSFNVDQKNIIASNNKNHNILVQLLDANGQVQSEKTLITDDYGTAHSFFTLPKGLLPGSWTIKVGRISRKVIKVEEYKRPTFKVEIDQPEGLISLGDSVNITGNALAYAGYPIAQANVQVKVVKSLFRFPGCFYYWFPSQGSEEIVHQEVVKSDDDGNYRFNLPTRKESGKKYYNYKVIIDVTNISGETHSSTLNLYIGSDPRRIQLSLNEDVIEQDDRLSYMPSLLNAVNQQLQDKIDIKISKLVVPKSLFRERNWAYPDTIIPSKNMSAYKLNKNMLPYMSDKDQQLHKWEVESVIIDKSIQANKTQTERKLDEGVYRISATHADGTESIQHVFVVNSRNHHLPDNSIIIITDKNTYEVGDEAIMDIYAPNGWKVNLYVYRRSGQIQEFLIDNDKDRRIRIPISREDMGGIMIKTIAFYSDRTYSSEYNINIPFRPFNLNIKPIEIDSILKPGEKAIWKFQVLDDWDNPIVGKVTATLYDASLDALYGHSWYPRLFKDFYRYTRFNSYGLGNIQGQQLHRNSRSTYMRFSNETPPTLYTILNSGLIYRRANIRGRRSADFALSAKPEMDMEAPQSSPPPPPPAVMEKSGDDISNVSSQDENKSENQETDKLRENLNELVFFYPDIISDSNGIVSIEFEMNEALTEWKLMLFGQTKDMKIGTHISHVKTQKDLMIVQQFPRFLREGDRVSLSALIVSPTELMGNVDVSLKFYNGMTGEDVTDLFSSNSLETQVFLGENGQANVEFSIDKVPSIISVPLVKYQINATLGNYSDAVSDYLPMQTNRVLINETKSFYVPAESTKTITFEDYLKHSESTTMESQFMELQYTPNPAWMAVKALAYVNVEDPTTTTLVASIYSRYIARYITEKYPEIQEVFKQWQSSDELKSELERNPELLNSLLQSTPWIRAAQSEREQRESIALLFDLNNLNHGLEQDIKRLKRIQKNDGGFPWIDGSKYSSTYVTISVLQHISDMLIVTDQDINSNNEMSVMMTEALSYLDREFEKYYNNLEKHNLITENLRIPNFVIRYFIFDNLKERTNQESLNVKKDKLKSILYKNWNEYSYFNRLFIARLSYLEDRKEFDGLLESLTQPLVNDEELGAYYKGETQYEYQSRSVLINAYLIELLDESGEKAELIPLLQLYILQNKRTQMWGESSLTMKVVNSFLSLGNKNWLINSGDHSVSWNNRTVFSEIKENNTIEYEKRIAKPVDVSAGIVKVSNNSENISWGSLHWQYFEDLDKVASSEEKQPLSIERTMFKRIRDGVKEKYVPVEESEISVGDRIKVRLTVRSDRKIDFVHIQDFRASGTEPVDVLSRFNWDAGMYYYQVTRDLSTDFYIERLSEGTHILDYDMNITHKGEFSAGIARIQSYYAPEMSGQSEGSRLVVK